MHRKKVKRRTGNGPNKTKQSFLFRFHPCSLKQKLTGGFKHFLFSPLPGEMIQFDWLIFFNWVVQPPTRKRGQQVILSYFTAQGSGPRDPLRPSWLAGWGWAFCRESWCAVRRVQKEKPKKTCIQMYIYIYICMIYIYICTWHKNT